MQAHQSAWDTVHRCIDREKLTLIQEVNFNVLGKQKLKMCPFKMRFSLLMNILTPRRHWQCCKPRIEVQKHSLELIHWALSLRTPTDAVEPWSQASLLPTALLEYVEYRKSQIPEQVSCARWETTGESNSLHRIRILETAVAGCPWYRIRGPCWAKEGGTLLVFKV